MLLHPVLDLIEDVATGEVLVVILQNQLEDVGGTATVAAHDDFVQTQLFLFGIRPAEKEFGRFWRLGVVAGLLEILLFVRDLVGPGVTIFGMLAGFLDRIHQRTHVCTWVCGVHIKEKTLSFLIKKDT